MSKQDKLIAKLQNTLTEIKEIKEEYLEYTEILKETIQAYELLTKSFNKAVPKDMFS